MGPLIKIKSAVKQVVLEHSSGSPVGPAEVGPLREEVLPPAPTTSPRSLGASESPFQAARVVGQVTRVRVTSSPQAGAGDRDGDRDRDEDMLCCLGRHWRRAGSRAVPDARNSPLGSGICL